jgi:hypothetical protein
VLPLRPPRIKSVVYFGIIASGNQVIRDRSQSLHQTRDDSLIYSPTYQHPHASAQAFKESPEPAAQPRYSNFDKAQPPLTFTRSQSQRVRSSSHLYQNPAVNVIGPLTCDSTTIYDYPSRQQTSNGRCDRRRNISLNDKVFLAYIHQARMRSQRASKFHRSMWDATIRSCESHKGNMTRNRPYHNTAEFGTSLLDTNPQSHKELEPNWRRPGATRRR